VKGNRSICILSKLILMKSFNPLLFIQQHQSPDDLAGGESIQPFFKYYRSALAFSLIASTITISSSTVNAAEIPTTPAAWTGTNVTTGTGNTEAATKDTPSGLRMRVSVGGSNTGVLARNNTTLMTQGNVLLPVLPAATNGLQLLTDFSNCPNGTTVLTCSSRGSFAVEFLDTANTPIKVRNPILHWSRLGGAKSQSSGGVVTASFLTSVILELSTPNLKFNGVSGSSLAVSSGVNNNIRWAFPTTAPASAGVCATTTSSAGCGSTPITDVNGGSILIDRLDFNVTGERTNGSILWNVNDPTTGLPSVTQDGYFLTASFEEDYGDAPASFDVGGAASHIISDLALGSTIDADNSTIINGGATGTPLVGASPNAVAAGTSNNGNIGDGADEDGVVTWAPLTTNATTYSTTVAISGVSRAARVCSWIDFNRNNTFDNPTERACADVAIGQTSATLNWTGISGLTAGQNYARVRLSYDLTGVQNPKGALNSGEVEDYQIPITAPVSMVNITGKVFEDVNYGGGVGRNFIMAGSNGRQNARVELYNNTGAFVSSVFTDISGNYSFTVNPSNTYTVRVVNNSVTSSRPGYINTLVPVQTFRTNGLTTNVGTADSNRVGGESPTFNDAGNGSTTLVALNSGNITAQSISSVSVGTANATGIDFGYNFDTIVNTNNAGQGSLRQFILNSNTLGGEASLTQVGNRKDKLNINQSLPAGVETSIFMIPSNADPLGRAKDPGYDTARGIAQIIPLTLLPTVTGANANSTSIDGTTQTVNIGNNNAGVLGRGGKVGVDQLTLNQVQRPEIEIFGNNQFNGANDRGLKADGVTDFTARGLATYNFYISIEANNATRPTVEQNVLGAKADNWADPGTNRDIHKNLLFNTGTQSGLVQNNLLGFTTNNDSLTFVGTTTSTITNNDCQAGAVGSGTVGDCYTLYDGNTNNIIRGNLATDISANGIDILRGSNSNLIENNTIRNAGTGGTETAGIRITDYYPTPLLPSNSNTIKRNIVFGSVGSGILVTSGLGNTITENSLYANGALGIDLLKNSELADRNTGIAPYITANDGLTDTSAANNDIDYPIITSTKLDATGTLKVSGYVGKPVNVANFGNAKLEFFIADNSPANQNGEVILGDGKSKPHGEGRTFIGSCNALGDSKFSCTFANAGTLGLTDANNITATATDGSGNTSEFSSVLVNPANLVLVKRITAIKDTATNTTTTFNSFVDDSTTNNLLPGWTVGTGSYLLGALNNGAVKVKPGDEVEYTIYYLNSGGSPISKARVCDRLNKNLAFQNQFSTTTAINQGIEFTKDISSSYPTNTAADNDAGFYSTSSTLPINCNLTANTTFDASNISDSIVVVDVARIADPLLGIVSDPLIGGQRGYIKFKVKVQQ
jgi:GEVED domain/Right handed beta helix region